MNVNKEGRLSTLEDTHDFVEDLHEKQAKAEKNSKRKGNSHKSHKLPSKEHSNNS